MSKFILFDFTCQACDATFEALVTPDVRRVPCPTCDSIARRQISAPRIDRTAIALTAGASPESIAHFDRVHRERRAIEERSLERHGDYGKPAGAD